ncbi:hypothetical protein HPP92_019578 [Vanilla planifolia]|uniref:Late embryogenesis abundant protein LEA-2 subgroup domain-containing protein n=1 Tax=Vanilla planifolia TaxID=51239 RepID=A0A835UJG1_VANPL|nr:hypothetical protein HPP92_019578 [Vanilla planifolia]
MADRIHPSAKANPNPSQTTGNSGAGGGSTAAAGGKQPTFPATKGQLYNRPVYRPQPPSKYGRKRRGCCCSFCCWFVLILLALVLLAAIAGGVFYVIYRPRRPDFSVSSIRLAALNVSTSNQLSSRLDVAVTARNPNRKIAFLTTRSRYPSSNGADIGDGSFPAFVHEKRNTTVLRATVSSSGHSVDPSVAADLRKSSVPLEIDLETKAGIKIGKLKTKKVRVMVRCAGIDVTSPMGKKTPVSSTPRASCKVKLHIKIWKWTI